tara:strand:- start:1042 stop:1290 length:249 start_codon:yes stop_codon:yes gene_type:complete
MAVAKRIASVEKEEHDLMLELTQDYLEDMKDIRSRLRKENDEVTKEILLAERLLSKMTMQMDSDYEYPRARSGHIKCAECED